MTLEEFYKTSYLPHWVKKRNRPGTIRNKENVFEKYILYMFGDRQLDSFTKLDWVRFENYLRINKKLTPKTIKNHQGDLRHILNKAKDWEVIDKFPRIDIVEAKAAEPKPVDGVDIKAMLSAAIAEPPHIYAMFVFALATGMRIGELRGLQWQDFFLEDGLPMVKVCRSVPGRQDAVGPTKGGRARLIPLNDDALAAKQAIYGGQDGKVFVFSVPDKALAPLTYKACDCAIKRICRRAKIPAIGWHALRHTVCTMMLSRNVALIKARDVMGHVDIRTTMGYVKLKGADLLSAVATLDHRK